MLGATCDVCNGPTSWELGTSYSADEFRTLVARGFEPDPGIALRAASFGVSRDVAIHQWKYDLVAHTMTGWLLCPSCVARAAAVRPTEAPILAVGSAPVPAGARVEPEIVDAGAVTSGAQARFCDRCGATVPGTSLFCGRCGHDLRASAGSQAPMGIEAPPARPAPTVAITAILPPTRERRVVRPRTALLLAGAGLLVVVGVALSWKGSAPSGAPGATTPGAATAPTAAVSDASAKAPSPLPPLRAGPVAEWDDMPVTTVCLTGSQAYPQEPDLRLPVNTWLRSLLLPLGIALTGKDGPCDATMKVSVRIVATPAKYGADGVTMYTAGDRAVTVTLTAADRKPIVFKESVAGTPSKLASSSSPRTPHDFLVNQSGAVADDLLDAAVDIWGAAVAVEALCMPVEEKPYVSLAFEAEQRLLDASSLRDALGTDRQVPNDYASWRRWFETGDVAAGEGGSAGCR